MFMTSFKTAMERHGLVTKDRIVADEHLRRFHIIGDKPGSKNGWYVLYSDPFPAGAFGNWRTGDKHNWSLKRPESFTQQECEAYKRRMIEANKAREQENQNRQRQARDKAQAIWQNAPLAPDTHPYLVKKHVQSHGLRVHKEALVIPMRDAEGMLHSLQFIDGDGNKRFLSGGKKKGCYFAIGDSGESLAIAEGYSTAASIHETLELPVAVAFDAGNLLSVSQALKAKYPDKDIIVCADNDTETKGNPGLTKAKQAAVAINARLAIPPISGDFNDFYNRGNND